MRTFLTIYINHWRAYLQQYYTTIDKFAGVNLIDSKRDLPSEIPVPRGYIFISNSWRHIKEHDRALCIDIIAIP